MAAVATRSTLLNTVLPVTVLTILAVALGGTTGKLIVARLRPALAAASGAANGSSPYTGDTDVRELAPILTNLADAAHTEVRLQASIVYQKKAVENPTVLMAKISDDLVAFLKTLSVEQIQGASGLQNLRDDLNERAAVRSQGLVREIIIETLVVQ
jgi:flagellar protein FliL